MKCPKCSYTSFDYLDACRKCGADLRDARTILQIIAVSPEERAVVSAAAAAPAETTPSSGYEPRSPYHGADYASPGDLSSEAEELEPADESLLADLNFDESFQGIVEPTSYRQQPAASAPQKPAPASSDDDLLDLDFGDVFAEKEEDTD